MLRYSFRQSTSRTTYRLYRSAAAIPATLTMSLVCARLPVEVMTVVCHAMPLMDLPRLALVSSSWNLAVQDPRLYCDLSFDKPGHIIVKLLERSRACTVSLKVQNIAPENVEFISQCVHNNIHRMGQLELELVLTSTRDDCSRMWSALAGPAPCLQHLTLSAYILDTIPSPNSQWESIISTPIGLALLKFLIAREMTLFSGSRRSCAH